VGSKGSNTTTTSTAPNPVAGAAYQNLISQAGQVAATPYTPYTGELTAPVNQQQQAGIGGINQYAQYAQPYIQQAAGLATAAASPITGQQIQNYENPYTQQVVNSTEQQFANTNAQQQQQVLGNAAAQGALGGDRTAVAQSVLAGQQQAQEAPVIAGLESQGYNTALSTALQEQQAQAQGAYSLGNLGVSGENAALTGANAQVGAGTLEQQTQQAQDTAAYQQFLQQQAYPYQQLSFEAGIDTGVGSQLGGTSETTAPAPSQLAQDFGYGALGLGSLGSLFSSSAGGTSAIAGLGAFLSDKRAKENIKKIGKLHDGQNIYRFNYKGDTATRIGLIAQEVEKKHPEAVSTGDGLKVVDYDAATKEAVRRALGGPVKGLATGGNAAYPLFGGGYGTPSTPYTGGPSWIPGLGITRGPGPPRPPQIPNQNQGQSGVQSAQQMFKNAAGLASGFGSGSTGILPSSNPSQNLGFSPVAEPTGDISDNMIYNRGGGVPVRAGLGLPSFLRRARGGFADGGTPYDQEYFDAAFGSNPQVLVPPGGLSSPQRDIVSNPSTMQAYHAAAAQDAALEYPNIGSGAAYGQQNPYAPAQSTAGVGAPDALPPEILGSPTTQAASPAMGYAEGQPTGGLAAPQELAPQETAPSGAVAPVRGQQQPGFLGLSPDFYQSLMAAGAGALASRSPYAGVGIGQGVETGLSEYGALQKQHQSEQEQQSDIALKVRQLDQAAKAEQDKVAAETRPYSEMTAAQKADLEFKQRAEQREESQPVTVGHDMMGNPIMGVRAPNGGGFLDPITMKPITGTSLGVPGAVSPSGQTGPIGQATQTGPNGKPVQLAMNEDNTPQAQAELSQILQQGGIRSGVVSPSPDLSPELYQNPLQGKQLNEQALDGLTPGQKALVHLMVQGKISPPTSFALAKPFWQNMLSAAALYDPDGFDAAKWSQRNALLKEMTSGITARNVIRRFNTVANHLDQLDRDQESLNNWQSGTFGPLTGVANRGRAAWLGAEQDPRIGAVNLDADAVSGETALALKGAPGTESQIKEWRSNMTPGLASDERRTINGRLVNIIRGQMDSVADQWNRGFGTSVPSDFFVSPKARAIFSRMGEEAPAPTEAGRGIDPRDAAALKANANNPAAVAAIDRKYGQGTAARLLGTQ
jgi:hypothetical protein